MNNFNLFKQIPAFSHFHLSALIKNFRDCFDFWPTFDYSSDFLIHWIKFQINFHTDGKKKKGFCKATKRFKKIFFERFTTFSYCLYFRWLKGKFFQFSYYKFLFFFKKTRKTQIIAEIFFQDFFCVTVTQKKRAKKDSNLYAKISFYTKMLFFCEAFFRWFSYGKFYHLYSLLLFFVIGIFFLSLFSVFIYWRCESVFVKILVFLMELIGLKVDVQFI